MKTIEQMLTEKHKKNMIKNFVEMVKIDSESFEEKEMVAWAEKTFKKLGCKVMVDNAGKGTKSNAKGNVIAKFPGTVKSKPMLLSCHLDTVVPGKGIKPTVKKDRIVADGTTILGADCKGGIAIIMEILLMLKENKGLKYPPLEILLTIAEEAGMYGAKNLNKKDIQATEGMILDSTYCDTVSIKAPSSFEFDIKITGVAAHAGVCPENGISAIEVAAKAIGMMNLGRIDKETTSNIGVINGGKAINIVTPELMIKGEARSHNAAKLKKQAKHMEDCFKKAVVQSAKKVDGKKIIAKLDFKKDMKYPDMKIPATANIVKTIVKSGKQVGITVKPYTGGGGCDGNVLSHKGILTPNLGFGEMNAHTVKAYLDFKHWYGATKIAFQTVLNYRK
ncbi:MAG: M20/M25/M40 family metallo-hydrolase [Elusimicrobiaceae bacterium]|jgi:tripeptide aminopeptidase|nr:M20/M25/M40 family metallo-hydrolase [Elusimicrobiaceae bacterium]MBT3954537.1 M20/M25/M40 family metallo-hydrolase [Elusimicrobiaceae bacterium]MBT4402825.1 M20/M25/M40 family metallo-hydrolase [Elusimicrobiaceae bacterium]MBT4439524.1 M20/M25/M40 family metallo-hydrolase [Elusimicrobiaceae bacterium]MBT5987842.1 M20/M25/M40 family metallo-hydrolase [Elusimicrobiaceae bacterium]